MNEFLGEGPTIIESFDPNKVTKDIEIAKCKYCNAECSSSYDIKFHYNCPVCRHSREREDIYYVTERRQVDFSYEGWLVCSWRIPKVIDSKSC